MLVQEIVFLLIGILAAIICSVLGAPDAFSIICSFLPVVISIFCENVEKINLMVTKISLFNKTVGIKVSTKNTLKLDSLGFETTNSCDEFFKSKLLENNVAVGNENNILRIEGNQTVSFGKNRNIFIKMPILVFLSTDNDNLVCTLRNSSESIAYRDISNMIRSMDSIWDFINDQLRIAFNCQVYNAFYEAEVKIDTNKFKNVYLKSYAQKWIKDVQITRNNVHVKLGENTIKISSNCEQDFEKAIKKYSGLFGNFFREEK